MQVSTAAAVLALVYVLARGSQWIATANVIAITAVVLIGWVLLFGLAGQFSLGHAAFFGVAGYTSALLARDAGVPVFPAMLIGVALAGAVGAAVAIPLLRFRGFYLALATLALAAIAHNLASSWTSLTGGASGLADVPSWNLGIASADSDEAAFVFLWLVVGAAWLGARWTWRSPFGTALVGLREDETASASLGFVVPALRVRIFVLSTLYAGAGGALFAHYQNFIAPTDVGLPASFNIVLAGIVGGTIAPVGGILGSGALGMLTELLAEVQDYQPLIFGLLLVVAMMFFQGGIAGIGERLWRLAAKALPEIAVDVSPVEVGEGFPSKATVARPIAVRRGDDKIVVRADGLTRTFGGITALNNATFSVLEAETFAIIGPNGAGKTTLFNAISGLVPAESGSIELLGTEARRKKPWEIARLGVARTFQTPHIVHKLSMLENIALGVYGQQALGASQAILMRRRSLRLEREAYEIASAWARRLGLESDLHVGGGDLPFVQQRKVEIARALSGGPSVLLLDEPGAGLNEHELDELAVLLRSLVAEHNLTLLVIDHQMSLIFDIADRVLVLNQGRVLATGTPREIATNVEVLRAYLGEDFELAAAGVE